jgi:hypothetical protein
VQEDDSGKRTNPMSRVSVGKCPVCGLELKVKAHAVKPNLWLTCKCGNTIQLHPSDAAILESECAANTVQHQLSLLSKRLCGNNADLALFNFVNAHGFTKPEIIQAASDVLSGVTIGDRVTAVAILAHLNTAGCMDVLALALRDSEAKVRRIAAKALVRVGENGNALLRGVAADLTAAGFAEASEELSHAALEYEKTHADLRKMMHRYPKEIICVFNKDVYLSEPEIHITNYNLTDDELRRLSDRLKADGYKVTEATPDSSHNFRFRGIAVFPKT